MGGVRIARVLPVGHRRWRRAVARGGWVAGVSGGRGGVPRRGGTAGIAPWAIVWTVSDLVDHLEHHCHRGWEGGKGWEVRGFMRGMGVGERVEGEGVHPGESRPRLPSSEAFTPQRRSHLRGPQRPSAAITEAFTPGLGHPKWSPDDHSCRGSCHSPHGRARPCGRGSRGSGCHLTKLGKGGAD